MLVLTTQFPNPLFPHWATFNRQQMDAMASFCRLGLVAPVPWTELMGAGSWRLTSQDKPYPVHWPVFWYLPRFRRHWHARCLLWSAWPQLRRLAQDLRPQVLLATWLFPSGWAGMMAARRLGLPFVLKVHGSDVMVFKDDPRRRPYLQQALTAAQAVVAVSRSLAEEVVSLGAEPQRVHLIGNGLNQGLFTPGDRELARRRLGLDLGERLLLFVGRLVPVKGLETALRAMVRLPRTRLVVVGQGPQEASLKALARDMGLYERVIWAGPQPHQEVPSYMAAADAVVLPSLSEGDPNSVLEALGCGRPVVAARVGGVPEVVHEDQQGSLFEAGDAAGLAQAAQKVLGREWDPGALSASVAGRSWQASAAALLDVLERVASQGAAS
ncbi:MAG: glycosyltransferase family 4 protein [Desulfarculus sp.]|nr:MAG: glycosyltransferase family 4 protein [Desulfarculus sp.]